MSGVRSARNRPVYYGGCGLFIGGMIGALPYFGTWAGMAATIVADRKAIG